MNAEFSEIAKVELAVISSDIDTADVTGSVYYDASNFRRIYAKARTATNLTSGKKLTLTLMQATSAAGGSAKALGTAVEFTADATEKGEVEIDALTSDLDLDGGFTFVGLKLGSDLGSAVVAAGTVVLSDPRFAPVA